MENVVNLEQLDYRDQMIKEYIDTHSGSSGSSLFCELEVITDYDADWHDQGERGKLYIKCYKGELLESDEIQFARNKVTPIYWEWKEDDEEFELRKKRRGWIIPHNKYNYVNLYKVYDEERSNTSEIYDYWEVLPKKHIIDGDDIMFVNTTWTELIDEFLRQRHNSIDEVYWYNNSVVVRNGYYNLNYAAFINHWCGLAIKRDNRLITNYKRWRITGPHQRPSNNKHPHFLSCFAEIGTYITGCGPKETKDMDEKQEYLYGFEI